MSKKLKDLYDLTDAVFTDLQSLDVPWKNKNIAQKLDIAYMGNQSGNKWASPLLEQFIDDNGEISAQDRATIASVIFALNNENWTKLYATLSFEYDPIENYSMVEQMTNDSTVTQYGRTETRTDNLTHAKRGTEQTAYNSTDTRTDNLTHTKAGSETLTHNTTDTRTDNLTHTKAGSETLTHNTTDTRTDNLTHTKAGSETVTREDNDVKRDQSTLTKEGSETLTKNNTKTLDGGETRTPNINTSNSVYAFNSTTPAPTTISSNNGTETTQFLNRSDTESGSETSTFNNRVDRNNSVNEENKTGTETTSFTDRTDTDAGTSANVKTGTETTSFAGRIDTDAGTSANAKTGSDTLTHNTSETDTGTQTNANSGSDTSTRNYTLTRSGNIGVTTAQQMIESERNLWLWNFFYKVVFPDVDKVLTLSIY